MALLVDSEVLRRQIRGALKNVVDQHGTVGPAEVDRVAGIVVNALEAMDRNYVPRDNKKLAKVQALEERDGAGCYYCRAACEWFAYTFDHDLPRSRGGTRAVGNLRLACRRCNGLKGALTSTEFLATPLGMSLRATGHPPLPNRCLTGDEVAARREARRQGLTQPVAAARGAEQLSGYAQPPTAPQATGD